jgi:two-component system response regulator
MSTRAILVVDDSDAEIALTLRAIKKSGVQADVLLAHNGVEALDLLLGPEDGDASLPRELPWIVLLDLKMPDVDGLSVLRRIRAEPRTRRLPVVMLSSSNELSDVGTCYDTGANSYIRKRVDLADFTEAMRLLQTYWTMNELPPPPARS